MTHRVGILGVGHLAEYLVPGLLRGMEASRLVLSPRNSRKSAALAERYGVAVALGNGALVEACDLVLLATRRNQAVDAVSGLPWREDQVLVSVCAGVGLAELAPIAGKAGLARAMPIAAAALGESPTCLFPDLAMARAVLTPLGPLLAMPDEATFETACVSAAFYGWVHALIGETTDWAEAAGVPAPLARELIAQTARGAAAMVCAHPDRPIEAMTRELCTPGGITQAGLDLLRGREAFAAWREACDAALARMR